MSDSTDLHDPIASAFDDFRGEALPLVDAPGTAGVRATVRRRQQVRKAAAVCAISVLGGAAFAFNAFHPEADTLQPADPPAVTASPAPTPSSSPKPSVSPSAPAPLNLRTVNWRNGAIPIPKTPDCPGGRIALRGGEAGVGGYTYRLLDAGGVPKYGDVNGDGREDALLRYSCGNHPEVGEKLAAVSAHGAELVALGSIALENWGVHFGTYRVASDGTIVTTVIEGLTDKPRTQTRRYRWDGQRFAQVGGPTKFGDPPIDVNQFDWSTATLTIPFQGARATTQPNDRSCPRATVTFTHPGTHAGENQGEVRSGGCAYWLHKVAAGDFDGDGVTDALVRIMASSLAATDMNSGTHWFFAYTMRDNKPALLGFITAAELPNRDAARPNDISMSTAEVAGRGVRVTQIFRTAGKPDQALTRTFSWTGSGFAPNRPPPNPRADARP